MPEIPHNRLPFGGAECDAVLRRCSVGIGRRVPGAGTGGGLGEVRSSHHRRL